MRTHERIAAIVLLAMLASAAACAGGATRTHTLPPPEKAQAMPAPPAPAQRKLVAVAGFENKSTYAADKLWDTCSRLLSGHLVESGYFRVVEWERMKTLFDWDVLSTSSLVKSPESRQEAHRILLCEYFLSGAVTFFDVSRTAKVSALSKRKTLTTTVRVGLFLQEAASGEYVAFGRGEAATVQEYSGGLSGGGLGSWDPAAADRALDLALQRALARLVAEFHKQQ
jgi:curli biogenesis system outer membrane secretion channel CsgG